MIPIANVFGLLLSAFISNQIYTNIAVQAATRAGITQGVAVGAAGGVAATNPGLLLWLPTQILRAIHFPFYLVSNQRRLDQAYERSLDAFNAFLEQVQSAWSTSGDMKLTASDLYIEKIKTAHRQSGSIPSPELPPLSFEQFVTPDKAQTGYIIILSESASRLVFAIALVVGTYIIYRIVIIIARFAFRSGIRALRDLSDSYHDEKMRLDQEKIRLDKERLEKLLELERYNQARTRTPLDKDNLPIRFQ
jgi:hypothetical protein